MQKFTVPTDEQLKVRPYYAEIVQHCDENFDWSHDSYHVSSDRDVLFDLEFKTFAQAEQMAKQLNDNQAIFNPKGN